MMSRGQNPLIWMMAVTLPSAGHALGLGEIHVDSALNEPLTAEIDIVGATADELLGLRASVANRETFLHLGADRPAFLNTATFKVTQDAQGRPVLSIRSSESFTEPLVDFVVDLRWHNGELIRQYTLLLDPAGFPAATRMAQALPVPTAAAALPAPVVTITTGPMPTEAAAATASVADATPSASAASATPTSPAAATVSAPVARKTSHIKVGAKATLRGVAWRVGARAEPDLNRLMLAIFRENPSAFEGNINVLHLGALLTIPSSEVVEAIPKSEANREIHAQMVAWRKQAKSSGRPASPVRPVVAPVAAPVAAAVVTTPVATPPAADRPAAELPVATTTAANAVQRTAAPATAATSPANSENSEMTARIQVLESSLHDLQAELETQHNKMLNMQAQATYAEQQASVAAVPQDVQKHTGRGWITAGLAGLALLAGLVSTLLIRLRKRPDPTVLPRYPAKAATEAPVADPEVAAPVAPAKAKVAEPRVEFRQLQPAVSSAAAPFEASETDEADTAEIDVDAALIAARKHEQERLESEMVAERVREELAAAWSIPEAEEYGRFDDTVTTLAEALSKSMEDTHKMRNAADDDADTGIRETDETLVSPGDTAMLPAATVNMRAETRSGAEDTASTVPIPAIAAARDHKEAENLDYNLVDLDHTNQHVDMPSNLHENIEVKERRKNLVDVLKGAIEREPDRGDLHMKLLEAYYTAAHTNRQGFLDVVKKLSSDRNTLAKGQWEKIQFMARQIAAESAVSSGKSSEDEDLADCA
jgi:FimV-like protein